MAEEIKQHFEKIEETNPMDEYIRRIEKDPNFYFGIEFSTEEKRLLVGIYSSKRELAKFYQRIDNVQKKENIDTTIIAYREGEQEGIKQSSWVKIFTSALIRPEEYELFYEIIKKIEGGLENNGSIISEINKIFQNSSEQEAQDGSFRKFVEDDSDLRMKNRESKKKLETKKEDIKRVLKKELQDRVRIDSSFLDELKKDQGNIVDTFIRDIVKAMLKDRRDSKEVRQQLSMATKDLIWTVVNDIENS